MKDDKGILKDFNPPEYYNSKGHQTKKAPKKIRKWDEYVPKYVEYEEKPKKSLRMDADLDATFNHILHQLETQAVVEIKNVSNPKAYMKNMYAAAGRRGIQLHFSTSRYGDSVYIRK